MLKSFFRFERISILGPTEVFPKGIDWKLFQGLNVITGGTGLGKTTLVNAALFCLLGDFGNPSLDTSKIGKEYFRGRLDGKKKKEDVDVLVEASIGRTKLLIQRNLHSGHVVRTLINGKPVKTKEYLDTVLAESGLNSIEDELSYIADTLVYFGEDRFLISWDNITQSQITTLLFGEHQKFQDYKDLWEQVQSADSAARNLSYQAKRMEDSLDELKKRSTSDKASGKSFDEMEKEILTLESQLNAHRLDREKERTILNGLDSRVKNIEVQFQKAASDLQQFSDIDLDSFVQNNLNLKPNALSFLQRILGYVKDKDWSCPCCGKAPRKDSLHFKEVVGLARKGHCPICENSMTADKSSKVGVKDSSLKSKENEIAKITSSLSAGIFELEKTKSRFKELEIQIFKKEMRLADVREQLSDVRGLGDLKTLQLVIKKMRNDENESIEKRESSLRKFEKQKVLIENIQNNIRRKLITGFERYAKLFIDAECKIEFDTKGKYAEKRGPQVNATHSAFFPVIDGTARTRPQMLSEAQRIFIDLAFRMAVLEVWSDITGQPATLIVETPEGSVDIAYMIRVADLLKAFAKKGHQVIVTTNINNDKFLPRLLENTNKSERQERILDLMKHGAPRKLQIQYQKEHQKILQAAISGTT